MERYIAYMKKVNRIGIFLGLLLLAFLVLSIVNSPNYNEQPTIKNGVLDLSTWDFNMDTPIRLRGEWRFFWNQILEPTEIKESNASFYEVPKPWQGKLGNEELTNLGVATYELKIIVPQKEINYGLRILNIRMASKVFVNGELIGEKGYLSTERDSNYQSKNVPYTMYFKAKGPELVIVIQVANQYMIKGGIVQDIFLGSYDSIMKHYFVSNMWDIFIVTAILIMALYYAIGFMQMRRDSSQFYYFAFSILYAFIVATGSEKIFFQAFPNIPFEQVISVRIVVIFLSVISMSYFFREMDQKLIPKRVMSFFNSVFLLIGLISIFLSRDIYSKVESWMLMTIVIFYTYVIFCIIKDMLKRRTSLETSDLIMLFAITTAILGNLIANLLYNNAILNTSFFGVISLLVFLVLNAILVTNRFRRAYTKIEDLATQLLKADALKDEFLISTAHEFKTPLHGILNLTKVVLSSKQKELSLENAKSLKHIADISYRLSNLVNDILDLEALKENKINMEIKTFDCRKAIQIVIDVLKLQAEEKEIEIINRIPLQSIYVRADIDRVKQIAYNLIGNGIQFTSMGNIVVESQILEDQILITVTDTGIGISEEYQKDIFQGLGLSIASKLAIAMKGELKLLCSAPNEGSSFGLYLPKASMPRMEELEVPSMSSQEVEPGNHGINNNQENQEAFTILLVEEEAADIQVIRETLKGEGYRLLTVYSGEKAIAKVEESSEIDLVLLDVMLSDLSGYEVCEKIRGYHKLHELPILLLTARNTPEEVQRGFMVGANDFILKPFDIVELKARVAIHYNLKKSLQKAIRAEIKFLQGQIKPHFIYNALSVITSLCYIDGDRAGRLLSEFSNYLRLTFDVDYNEREISLEKEISLIKSYIEIEKARFAERVNVIFDIDESVLACRILPLLVQPLIENAIRYGILKRISGGKVVLKAHHVENYLVIQVEDDGIGMSKEKLLQIFSGESNESGIALKNIKRRMQETYGGGFEVQSEENHGTRFTLKIPYQL